MPSLRSVDPGQQLPGSILRATGSPCLDWQTCFSCLGARPGWIRALLFAGVLVLLCPWRAQAADRLRVMIETDAGGDPDDEQSLVRFLLYANEWDVEGIIANCARARAGENLNPERTGLGIVRRLIAAYGECQSHLAVHDPRYPGADQLLARTVAGYEGSSEGPALVLERLRAADPRPLWFLNWGTESAGATSSLQRALDRVLKESGPAEYARLKGRLRVVGYPSFLGDHTARIDPPVPLWVNTFEPPVDGRRWYHRFSVLTREAGGFDLERDLLRGHGPLGALYPTNTDRPQKEGDTTTFLLLVPNGLCDPEHPSLGGWAGRYGYDERFPGREHYIANVKEEWNGSIHRDNSLARWAADLQNDFRARLDWCVAERSAANHPPVPAIDGKPGLEPILHKVRAGDSFTLDASGSTDPDGHGLAFEWLESPPAASGQPSLILEGSGSARVKVHTDSTWTGREAHLLLVLRDSGSPPLARYRRVHLLRESSVPDPPWEEVVRWFRPPPEIPPDPGLRSPLRFADGRIVSGPEEWETRRREIFEAWSRELGPWPELLDRPELEVLTERVEEGITWRRVRIQIASRLRGEGWLLLPAGSGPFPAVLVVYYEPETGVGRGKEPLRDYGIELARRGFVTLSVGTPGGDAWHPATDGAACQPLSFHAYVAANCWRTLANLPGVDERRIGIVGHSYGGKWALFAACLFPKFACGAWSDPGVVFDESRPNVNYWEPWYLGEEPGRPPRQSGVPTEQNPTAGAYRRLRAAGHDLHELQALMAPRPFLVSGGSEDPRERWGALRHVVEVNQLLGREARVGLTTRPAHAPTDEANAVIYGFFVRFLGRQPAD